MDPPGILGFILTLYIYIYIYIDAYVDRERERADILFGYIVYIFIIHPIYALLHK